MSIDVFEQFFFLVVLSRKLMGYTCFARPSRTALASSTLAVITMVCDKCPFPLTVFLHIPPCASPSLSPLLPTAPLRSFPCSACLGRPRSSSLLPGFWVGADSRPVVSDLRLLWSPPLCPLRASVGLPLRRLGPSSLPPPRGLDRLRAFSLPCLWAAPGRGRERLVPVINLNR